MPVRWVGLLPPATRSGHLSTSSQSPTVAGDGQPLAIPGAGNGVELLGNNQPVMPPTLWLVARLPGGMPPAKKRRTTA